MIVRFKEKITIKSELISFPKNAQICRNITRKAKDINSISIGKEHKMRKNWFYKYVINKKKTKGRIIPLLNGK